MLSRPLNLFFERSPFPPRLQDRGIVPAGALGNDQGYFSQRLPSLTDIPASRHEEEMFDRRIGLTQVKERLPEVIMRVKILRLERESALETVNCAGVCFAGEFGAAAAIPGLEFRFVERAGATVGVSGLGDAPAEKKGVGIARQDSGVIGVLGYRGSENIQGLRVSATQQKLCGPDENVARPVSG